MVLVQTGYPGLRCNKLGTISEQEVVVSISGVKVVAVFRIGERSGSQNTKSILLSEKYRFGLNLLELLHRIPTVFYAD